ncbi:5' nucleotidase, NT5C type [Aegicerativicinus sediminis]|uniref:5' nucleotidase, NT5C type n=1 Tax=Aegicerativicinus sediminis TaxID=2893202 RepID=UPI001E4BD6BB|nr:5'(3')-deoxyribonucleotidase [Aegicerativicinus sediminis]
MRIFIDMDEVIADTYGAHLDWYNREFEESLTRLECHGKEVMHAVPEDRKQSIRNHCTTKGFFRDLTPIKYSQKVLKDLAIKHEVYIASAAMQFPNSLEEKSQWLDEFFPFIPWQNRILCGHKHVLNGDVLIDDRALNLHQFNGRKLLFSSPHNLHETDFERVDNWLEVEKLLL